MPFTLATLFVDIPELADLGTTAEAAFVALPATGRKAVDYATALGCTSGTLGYKLAVVFDTLEGQFATTPAVAVAAAATAAKVA